MKKFFTLLCAFVACAGAVNAATVDEVSVCKHSYVLVADDYTNNGQTARVKGSLFGDGYFLDVTGGSIATNKGKSNPAEIIEEKDEEGNVINSYYRYGEEFAAKYGEYGEHLNSLRLKNAQDVIAMKVTMGSKLIFLMQGNNKTGKDARWPKIAKDAALTETLNDAPTADFEGKTDAGFKYEWTAPDDMTIYIGSYNGDMFVGFLIVEANEAPGTPMVKVGPQSFENGLYFREVTCTPSTYEGIATVVTYTTDGTTPDAASPVYTAPIKCYADQVVKFQAYMDMDDHVAYDEAICPNADNEAVVGFSFNSPAIEVEGANVIIVSEYEGAKNFVSYLDQADVETSSFTLTESATITAYSQIVNGSYATFTTKASYKDVYVLSPIKEKKTITVSGTAVVDEEATAASTTGTVYVIQDGAITADKADFFVKNLEFGAIANDSENAKYQVPAGQEAYIKMNQTNITFQVAEGDSVTVKVVLSKNSCKTLNADNDESVTTDRKCYVNVSGTTYGTDDITNGDVANLEGYANVIEFGLTAGTYTFQKYSGTGNIFVSSIEITPAAAEEVSAGKALAVTCEKKANAWDNQIFINFSKPLEKGTLYIVTMDVKGTEALEGQQGQYGWEAIQPIVQDNNTENRDEWGGPADLQYMAHFCVTTDWVQRVKDHDGNWIYTDGNYPYSRLLLNLGAYNGTITIDNMKVINASTLEVVELNTFDTEAEQALVENGWMNLPKEFVDSDAPMAITTIEADAVKSNVTYNLMGQKTTAVKGLMIRNGKLIMVK